MIRTFVATASAAMLVALSPTATASEQQIKTSDLDLATPAGQAKLDTRIMRAARAACARQNTGTRLARSTDGECVAKAAASAREALATQAPANNRGG